MTAPAGALAKGCRLATYLVLTSATLSPLCWVSVPPLVDYPNHLARMWVLAHADEIPALAANYQPAWRLLPNLAMDLIVPGLARVMPIEVAGRLFIALTLVLLVLGTAALRRALWGKSDFWPLLALLFLYNSALLWGFLNYLFGLGAALLVFSLWLATAQWRPALRLPIFAGSAALIFVLHLFAFGLYGLLIGSLEFGEWVREPRPRRMRSLLIRSVSLLQFAPAGLLWLASLPNGGPAYSEFGLLYRKIYAAFAPVAWGFSPPWLPLLILVAGGGALVLAGRSHALGLAPAMRWPLAAVAAAAIVMPYSVDGSSYADYRLPVALPFLLIAAIEVRNVARRTLVGFAALAMSLLAVRIWGESEIWRHTDRSFAEFRADIAVVPPGARLLVVHDKMPVDWRWPDAEDSVWILPDLLSFNHVALLAVIDRSVFVPTLFSGWTVIQPTARNDGRWQTQGDPLTRDQLVDGTGANCGTKYWCDWPEKFEYLLWIDFGRSGPELPPHLNLKVRGSFFTLYHITPSQGG
jgi:hypothetical protein